MVTSVVGSVGVSVVVGVTVVSVPATEVVGPSLLARPSSPQPTVRAAAIVHVRA